MTREHEIDDSRLGGDAPPEPGMPVVEPGNCPECFGSGATPTGEVCPLCQGTGKANARVGGG